MSKLEVCQVNATRTSLDPLDTWSPTGLLQTQLEESDIGRQSEDTDNRRSWEIVAHFGATTKSYWAQWESLELRDEVAYRRWENPTGQHHQLQLLLPKSLVEEVLQQMHDSQTGGHFGVAKVRERFYWLRCRGDVENWCRRCDTSASRKGPKTRSRGKLKAYNVGAPFERIAVHVMGPLRMTEKKNRYDLVVMDYFTK